MGNYIDVYTKTRPMSAMTYNDYADLLDMVNWIGRDKVEGLNVSMNHGDKGLASIEYLIPGVVGTTKDITLNLGDWLVQDGGEWRVYTDNQFRARFDREVKYQEDASYDGKRISFAGHSIYADIEGAMQVALAISQHVQEEQSKEYERLYAEGQFFRVHICRHRVAGPVSSEDTQTVEMEIEYTLEAAFELYMQEILKDQTACWNEAHIQFPDGRVLMGGELQEHVQNYMQAPLTTSEGDQDA